MVTKQNIVIGIGVLICGFIVSWFMFGKTGGKFSIQNPESDCCSNDQKSQGYECRPNCPPTLVGGEVFVVGYRCLTPEEAQIRNRYGCPK